jgi:hypothetical protein
MYRPLATAYVSAVARFCEMGLIRTVVRPVLSDNNSSYVHIADVAMGLRSSGIYDKSVQVFFPFIRR